MRSRKSALVYGDGDGRFLARLAHVAPALRIMAVDASDAMLRRARQRLPSAAPVQWVHADVRDWEPPREDLDLIVSHFFLDCLEEEEIAAIVKRVNAKAAENATWVVSEFAVPSGAIAGPAGRVLIRALYLAFGVMTGLSVRRLPQYGRVLRDTGWRLEDRSELLRGLLVSERWQRSAIGEN